MDVKALYPSITKELAAAAVIQSFKETTVKFNNINTDDLVKYVSLTTTKQFQIQHKIQQYIPTPKSTTTLNSFQTNPNPNQFSKPKQNIREDDENQTILKTILGIAISEAVKTAMYHHYFRFNNNIYRQIEGGSTGADLTGEISRIVMLLWDIAFNNKLKDLNINQSLYKRYVDDLIMILKSLKNYKYDASSNKLVHQVNPAEYDDDKATFEVLQQIANTIRPEIQFTTDVPSNHADKMMPVLDLNVSINPDGIVKHKFYKKEISHPLTIMKRSALSMTTKRSTIFNEMMRRIKNNSNNDDWTTIAEDLSEYSNCLRESGYNHQFRCNTIKGILKLNDQIQTKIEKGESTRYRHSDTIKKMKETKTGKYNNNWFRKDNITDILQVNSTTDSKLANRIKSELALIQNDTKTLVIEKSGPSVLHGLKKNQPNRTQQCPYDNKCPVDTKTDCMMMNTTYKITCLLCPPVPDPNLNLRSTYIGCSGRSLHRRSIEHLKEIQNDDEKKIDKNAMAKHFAIHHPNNRHDSNIISVKLLASHHSTLTRVIDEGIRLERGTDLANSKSEWGRGGGIIRLQPTRQNNIVRFKTTSTNNHNTGSAASTTVPSTSSAITNNIPSTGSTSPMTSPSVGSTTSSSIPCTGSTASPFPVQVLQLRPVQVQQPPTTTTTANRADSTTSNNVPIMSSTTTEPQPRVPQPSHPLIRRSTRINVKPRIYDYMDIIRYEDT